VVIVRAVTSRLAAPPEPRGVRGDRRAGEAGYFMGKYIDVSIYLSLCIAVSEPLHFDTDSLRL